MIANHLWQSTAFAALAAALAYALRNNRAAVRYCVWMAASLKFLIPFALLVEAGGRVPSPVRSTAVLATPAFAAVIETVDTALTIPAEPLPRDLRPAMLLSLWACGFLAVVTRWGWQWRRARRAAALEPGVFGIFRPQLRLPAGIEDHLSPEQLRTVIAHEMCHVRRHDNLFAAIHMVVESLFWFHPLVWWIGARLVEERERACDEEVLRQGADPGAYASGILQVCRLYLDPKLVCLSGVTGSDLKRRVRQIMTGHPRISLTFPHKAMLVGASALVLAVPLLIGIGRAQNDTFEVASVKPADKGVFGVRMQFTAGGGVRIQNATLLNIIQMAYDVQRFQIADAPGWISSEQFVIEGKGSGPANENGESSPADRAAARRRLQALLAERFHLKTRLEVREGPVYALSVARSGYKMKEATTGNGITGSRPGHIRGEKVGMPLLVNWLSMVTGRPVIDRTGLTGTYAFDLEWSFDPGAVPAKGAGPIAEMKAQAAAAEPSDPNGPTLFTALQEQLGLRLESAKGPVETIVIEKVERPTAN